MTRNLLLLLFPMFSIVALGQSSYWQQEVNYQMVIDFDATKHQFAGKQLLTYTNNSPDTLSKLYYHLYFNAFQPGSLMDLQSRTIADPDPRIGDRISKLQPHEIGYHKIDWIKQQGKATAFSIEGTICEVVLANPILPGGSTTLEMQFNSQVPVQIRRSGRQNSEGVDYTMTQWYPKLAEYDLDGWHTDPYIAREFHGVFGTFDVVINMDARYTIAGTGVLQNMDEIGHGYTKSPNKATKDKISWHFKADQVHDFAWAADTAYQHTQTILDNGTIIRFFYLNDSTLTENWEKLVPYTAGLFNIMNDLFGEYPYPEFSVIQGGDGGMEYPMCTMISGEGSFGGLVSVTVHEAVHNWYYGVLASNESKYPWMDEGFTTFAQNIVLDSLFKRRRLQPHERSFASYISNANSGKEEPLSTHADMYETNKSYGVNSYSKGCVFVEQLNYIIGQEAFNKGMKQYFNQWKFKHPTPDDFKRVMEKCSGMELDWYFDAWIGTTKTIDYGINAVYSEGKNTTIEIARIGTLPFPVEVALVLQSGKTIRYYIPLQIMMGHKPEPDHIENWTQAADWPWTYPVYNLTVKHAIDDIEAIHLNPDKKVADINPNNDNYPQAIIRFQSAP